jgi:DNA-binding NarL/FixJ family response regulator
LEVVGEAANGEDALAKIKESLPDLVVADINLPKISGLTLTKYISSELPDTRVVILSMHAPDTVAEAVMGSGARGYVCKKVATTELMEALETVAAGGTYFGPNFFEKARNRSNINEGPRKENGLSPREREVLVGIAEGLSNKEVAGRLGLGVRTVETHRESVMRKLNIHNVAGLTRFALQKGLVLAA